METDIPLNMNIRYNGINYIIDVYREDREAWVHVRRTAFNDALKALAEGLEEDPTAFISFGDSTFEE